jgi:O-antigen biosynthesis protein
MGAWSYLRLRIARSGGLAGMLRVIWRNFRMMGWGYLRSAVVRALYELLNHSKSRGRAAASMEYAVWRDRGFMWQAPRWPQGAAPGPLISVVMPVYRPDIGHFRAAVKSVQAQDYPHWELCLADDASGDEALRLVLEELVASDPRIKLVFRENNGHISACSNSALALATGEYVLLFDQDDLLPAHALGAVAMAVVAHPEAAIIYSDEDKVDEAASVHFGPYFKPDFDHELFLGQNLISHLGVYRRDMVMAVGGFRLGLEGSQDYDLALRVLEQAGVQRVVHIPEVLYHWRASRGSTALANSEKSYASVAARQAVSEHLGRIGVGAVVEPVPDLPFFNRVRYAAPTSTPSVRLVFLLPDSMDTRHAERTIRLALARADSVDWDADVLVAQDARLNMDQLKHRLSPMPGFERIRFQVIHHDGDRKRFLQGLSSAKTDVVCLVSVALTRCPDGWLRELVNLAMQPRFAAVAPRLAGAFGMQCHGGLVFPAPDHASHAFSGMPPGVHPQGRSSALQQGFPAVSPAIYMARRELWGSYSEASLFDSQWSQVEAMLSWRQQGLINLWTPFVTLHTTRDSSAGPANLCDQLDANQRERWREIWQRDLQDNGYNPNLSVEGDFQLAVRPG